MASSAGIVVAALDVADVNADDQAVLIRPSKTDAAGQRSVQFLGKPTVARVGTWLQAAGLAEAPCSLPSTVGERASGAALWHGVNGVGGAGQAPCGGAGTG